MRISAFAISSTTPESRRTGKLAGRKSAAQTAPHQSRFARDLPTRRGWSEPGAAAGNLTIRLPHATGNVATVAFAAPAGAPLHASIRLDGLTDGVEMWATLVKLGVSSNDARRRTNREGAHSVAVFYGACRLAVRRSAGESRAGAVERRSQQLGDAGRRFCQPSLQQTQAGQRQQREEASGCLDVLNRGIAWARRLATGHRRHDVPAHTVPQQRLRDRTGHAEN